MGKTKDTVQCYNCLSSNTKDSVFCHKCGTQLKQDRDTLAYSESQKQHLSKFGFSPGDNFGSRYRIIEEIGRGGMGVVYKTEDKELGITVALKMIRPDHSKNPRFIEHFRKETLLARSISQENIIRIYDLGEIDEIKYISMEYIKGQSLKELIHASGFLTIEATVHISKQICKALGAAHKKGIVHRDMKPQNIMIDGDGNVHVMDFGVAKSFEEEEMSVFRGITGTPPYLSPERAKGQKADHRSDIYAFGIIMFEMLTGKRPFEAETTEGYIQKHLYERPPSPSKINPRIPVFLEKMILKCLAKNKENRYQNAEDILDKLDIQEAVSKKAVFRKKMKKRIYAGGFIVFVLACFYAVNLYRISKNPDIVAPPETGKTSVAVMLFENFSRDERLVHLPREIQVYLGMDLSVSPYFRVLVDDRLYQILKDLNQEEATRYSSDILNKIAAEEHIEYFILGSIGGTGDQFRITFRIQKSQGSEVLSADTIQGMGSDNFNVIIDQLATKIRSRLLTSQEIAADIDKEIEYITTKSPEARALYIQGKVFYQKREYEKSIEQLEKAVAIDPGFAMAHLLIASNYSYLGYSDKKKIHSLKAWELKDRALPSERYRILGSYYNAFLQDDEKAIEAYKNLLDIYPDDEEATYMLGVIYENLEDWDTAMIWFEKVLEINKTSSEACIELAYIFMAKGMYDISRHYLQTNKEYFPSQIYFHRLMSHAYLYEGQFDSAQREVENALSLDQKDYRNISLQGNIHHIRGDYKSAADCYKKLLADDSPEARAEGYLWMARLCLSMGQYKSCTDKAAAGLSLSEKNNLEDKKAFLLLLSYTKMRLNQLSKALDYANQAMEIAITSNSWLDQKWALHLEGLIYIRMGRMKEAEKTAEQLRKLTEDKKNEKRARHYFHLMGELAGAQGRLLESVEYFKNALSLLPSECYGYEEQAFYMDSLASMYYRAGNREEAKKSYERISRLTWGQVSFGDIYALSFYSLGKIFQDENIKDIAIENYEKFLVLWDGADPHTAEKADAKRQVEVLKAGSK
jgi:tetratricopeptide (TPR) repeat protein/predicted Ser/Thr protein kinase